MAGQDALSDAILRLAEAISNQIDKNPNKQQNDRAQGIAEILTKLTASIGTLAVNLAGAASARSASERRNLSEQYVDTSWSMRAAGKEMNGKQLGEFRQELWQQHMFRFNRREEASNSYQVMPDLPPALLAFNDAFAQATGVNLGSKITNDQLAMETVINDSVRKNMEHRAQTRSAP